IFAVGVGVWASAGILTSILAITAGVLEDVWPRRRILATAALVTLLLLPVVSFAVPTLPLSPPAVRIQENPLAHHVGGLAVWLMFLAALLDRGAASPGSTMSARDDHEATKEDVS